MLVYVAGLSLVSNCFSFGPLVQGLTLAKMNENLSCGCMEIQVFYDIFVNCNWVVTRWQHTFTHKQYIEQHK